LSNILNQQDTDVILYSADDKHFNLDKDKFLNNLSQSEHYNRGSDKNRAKEVINLKEMGEQITSKLTTKEIFFLNMFAERSKPTSRR
jgi:hypothetical protein